MADDAANGYEDVNGYEDMNIYSIVDRYIVIRVNTHINLHTYNICVIHR